MSKRLVRWVGMFVVLAFYMSIPVNFAHAESLKSSNYQIDESIVGTDTLEDSSSANYIGSSASGDLSIGSSTSGNYQVEAGSQTTPYPTLSFSIPSGNINFGSFSSTSATVTTATFSVINYTSYGYVVQVIGSSPKNGDHTIAAMPVTEVSEIGKEQFGINLVANTSPFNFGANPSNGQFGFGVAANNYSTPNQFRFVDGETIASAPKSSGQTNYTISYLVNVDDLTPGGQYTSNQTLVVVGTY